MTKIKIGSSVSLNKQALANECLGIYAAQIVGGQWALAICCYLSDAKLRYSELRAYLLNISDRMLSLQLKQLEQQQIIQRRVYAEVPPRVEYQLSEIGMQLRPVLQALQHWGALHQAFLASQQQAAAQCDADAG